MIWILSGSRHGHQHAIAALHGLRITGCEPMVVHGGAPGVDEDVEAWCKRTGLQAVPVLAKWTEHGLRAGPERNRMMVRMGLAAQAVGHEAHAYGFPCLRSTGTWDLLAQAYAARLDVVQYWSLRDRRLVDVPSAEFCRQMADNARLRRKERTQT